MYEALVNRDDYSQENTYIHTYTSDASKYQRHPFASPCVEDSDPSLVARKDNNDHVLTLLSLLSLLRTMITASVMKYFFYPPFGYLCS